MIFKKCSVLNKIYGDPYLGDDPNCPDMVPSAKSKITDLIANASNSNDKAGKTLKDFFTMLAVCHTCMVEKDTKITDSEN